MPTNRRLIRRDKKRTITPEAIAAYQVALKLHNDPKSEEYEEDGKGGRRREYYAACDRLQSLLGREGWEEQILDTIGTDDPNKPPTGIFAPFDIASCKDAVLIRLELEKSVLDSF
jgi:hypothetical protein